MISWLSLSGGDLRLDGADLVLCIENPEGGLRTRALAAGFVQDSESESVFRAPLGWNLARAMRKWPGSALIEVEHSAIVQMPALVSAAPEKPANAPDRIPQGVVTLNRRHFFITGEIDRDGGFSPKTRFQENREAIETLERIEAEDREATQDEKAVLARFNGWGGISFAFGYEYPELSWHDEVRAWIREHLSTEEIKAANHSVLNAHYTPPAVVRGVWSALDTLAEHTGLFERSDTLRILEPSVGVGNFLGLMPRRWVERSRIVGVELDPIAARITHKIYPDADIRACGFEDIRVPDGHFDLVLSNIPFGNYSVNDPEFIGSHLPIHDYFILKAIRKTAPGGLVVVMTSAFTMDKMGSYARKQIAKEASLIGAVRLPDTSMSAQAGTRVTSDLLLFAKNPAPRLNAVDADLWIHTQKQSFQSNIFGEIELGVNPYFLEHPERVLGTLYVARGIKGIPVLGAHTNEDEEVWAGRIAPMLTDGARLAPAPSGLAPSGLAPSESDVAPQSEEPEEDLGNDSSRAVFQGGTEFFTWADGRVYRRYAQVSGEVVGDEPSAAADAEVGGEEDAPGVLVDLGGKALDRVKGMIVVRDAMNDLVDLETAYANDGAVAQAMARLNESYDRFAENHGSLNTAVNRRLFREDPSAGRLGALEVVDPESNEVSKADIFRARVIRRAQIPSRVDTPIEALDVVVADAGGVDLKRVAGLCGMTLESVEQELLGKRAIFRNPSLVGLGYEIAAHYLSGNVRAKLVDVLSAKEIDATDRWNTNIEALGVVIPKDIGPADIAVALGTAWLPEDVLSAFTTECLDLPMNFHLNPILKNWEVDLTRGIDRYSTANTTTWGTTIRPAEQIVDCACNHKNITVYDLLEKLDGTKTRVTNEKDTLLAEQKLSEITEKFARWIWADRARTEQLVRIYNDRFNGYVAPKYNGGSLIFPGMSANIRLRPHQKNAVLRSIQEGNTILGHQVGTGKTYVMVAAAMEWIRVGKASKVGICVPNHILEQIEREAFQLYPNAKILVVHKEDLSRERRARFLGKVANNVYDLVVMTHSMFTRIPVPKAFESQVLDDEIDRFDAWLNMANDHNDVDVKSKRRSVKAIASRIAKMRARRKELLEMLNKNKDLGLTIADLDIDALFVDESHNFKNLEADTGRSSELAAGIAGSQRAFDLYLKTKWLYDRRGEVSGVIFSTGTPVSNNLLEIFNLQRYIQPQVLSSMGLDMVSSWASTFLTPKRRWEPDPGGIGFVLRTRFVLVNAPELLAILRTSLDVVSSRDAGIEVPGVETHNVVAGISERQSEKMEDLASRVIAIRDHAVDPSEDNILKIISEGRQLSLDPRLLNPIATPVAGESGVLKWEMMAENIHEIWEKESASRATQLVFCDLGTPSVGRKGSFTIYDAVRDSLVEKGVPMKEIAFIHAANTDKAKGELLAKVRAGAVRILIGSTMKMGEGTNMQDRAVAIHHLDAPWRPSDIEQRDGRIVRQGNRHTRIARYIYTTKGVGFDEYTWTVLKTKAEAFVSILRGEPGIRVFDNEVDPSYAETVAITTGNPLLIEKLDVEREMTKARVLARGHDEEQWKLRMSIGGLKDRLEESTATLDRLRTLPSAADRLWSIDFSGFSFKEGQSLLHEDENAKPSVGGAARSGRFDVPRPKMLDTVRELSKRCSDPEQVRRIEAIRCGGVPVILEQGTGPDGKPNPVWRCGEMSFNRSADLEEALCSRDQWIQDRQERITYLHSEITKAEGGITGVNPNNEKVAELLLLMADIDRRMMESSSGVKTEEAQPNIRFAVR